MATCKTCTADILWVKKNDGWLPPFDMPTEMPAVEYVLVWNNYANAWQAVASVSPDVSENVALTPHKCQKMGKYEQGAKSIPADEFGDVPSQDTKGILRDNVYLMSKLASANREIERLSDHERLGRIAQKLSKKCPTCWSAKYEWCVYVADRDKETKQLHTER